MGDPRCARRRSELIFNVLSWPMLGIALLLFGFAPGAVLRVILLAFPPDDPRRRELLGEVHAVPRIERPFWVAEQVEVALFEGLRARIRRWRSRALVLRGLIRLSSPSPGWLTSVAVFLAGRKRPKTCAEFRSHMYDWPGSGLSRREQIRAARGLVQAALVMRLRDTKDLAWCPIDKVLGSRTLSNLFVWGLVMVTLVAIVRHDGRFGLVADVQDPVALGAFLYIAIKTGRWWRKIKLPEPKPRRAKE
jgi:hypothetical protein